MIEKTLKNIISACCENIKKSDINDNSNLVDDFGFTSISLIKLIVDIETEFDIEIADEYLNFETLTEYSSLVKMVEEHKEFK